MRCHLSGAGNFIMIKYLHIVTFKKLTASKPLLLYFI